MDRPVRMVPMKVPEKDSPKGLYRSINVKAARYVPAALIHIYKQFYVDALIGKIFSPDYNILSARTLAIASGGTS